MNPAAIAATLDNTIQAILADPDKARAKYRPAVATVVGGVKCRISGSGDVIETDMPPATGGESSAPSPGWFFRASLAACCATVIVHEASRRNVSLTKLVVRVEGDGDLRGMLGLDEAISAGHSAIRTNVEIEASNAGTAQLEDLVRWAADHSPVGCTVRDAPANTLSITTHESDVPET
jgi:uncharacterized OsmC-like protein